MSGPIGLKITPVPLILTKGRDFEWTFENVDTNGSPIDYPPGSLFFEFAGDTIADWAFTIAGSLATIKVESEIVDSVPARTAYQLVFLNEGEAAGGEPVTFGKVQVQGA